MPRAGSIYQSLFCFILCSGLCINAFSQKIFSLVEHEKKIIISKIGFIENIGQYGNTVVGYDNMGTIKFGYEGLNMPVLFTTKGLVYLQRKVEKISDFSENKKSEKEKENKFTATDRVITMEWVNANTNPQIVAEELSPVYHTYGLLQNKARVFKKLTYKELYPGIDLIYSFDKNKETGFEYSLLVKPEADVSKIRMRYGGDVKKIGKDKNGNLVIRSDIDGVVETIPVCYYSKEDIDAGNTIAIGEKVKGFSAVTKIEGMDISFLFDGKYDRNQTLIIDPFVTSIPGFTREDSANIYDIDFDYDGNIYARGGGNYMACELAKFAPNGTLQWIFHGTLTVPAWSFGFFGGGWVVEKSTGKIYIGQGQQYLAGGFRIIRLNSAGAYDNYITNPNGNFVENWKMIWNCNGGSPQLLVAGGGITSDINFSICSPPSLTLAGLNLTGVSGIVSQDVSDAVIDPETNAMYSIYCSTEPTAAFINNRIYKHTPPYSSATIAWSTPSGYNTLIETGTRPYLTSASTSTNGLAVNSSYFFYWDGKNLKAFDKSNGNIVGTALVVSANTPLRQGGIAADKCNNVFVGDVNGTIKVYKFDGSTFNDTGAPDINIPGFSASPVYALAYDNGKKLIYACGQGFVASIDISAYCSSQAFTVNINTDCVTASVSASLIPTPPTGSSITYGLYNGNTLVDNNSTGIFNSLTPNINYTIRAIINLACSGVQFEKDFKLIAPSITTFITAATCTQNIGSLTVTGTSGTLPYTYSLDGINFQSNNTFTGLSAGTYSITIKDANGCSNAKTDTVPVSGVNTVTVTAGINTTICEGTGTTLGATSNATSFVWTPTTGLSNSAILNPVASPVITTKYFIKAVSGPCNKTDSLIVNVNAAPIANAGNNKTICFGKDAQLNGSGGVSYTWTPASFLDNSNTPNPKVIQPLNTVTYRLQVTDSKGCKSINEAVATITVRPPEKLFAGNDTSIAINQPLQLNAIDINNTGFINYTWSPSYGLNNTAVKNPVAILDKNITYFITANTAENCVGNASIIIKVFKGPEIYVPTAFSPNGDSKNDILKSLPIGLKEFKYFAVFNRYGEQVFYNTNPVNGWNGKVRGKEQNTGNYVWIAEGVDYKGNKIKRKGSVILIK